MADEEQLSILRQGAEAWNQWKGQHLFMEVDLTEAHLAGADLTGADLIMADLSGANLSEADLRDANLTGANLHGANLSDADLSKADLRGANLAGAEMGKARLYKAYLAEADLSGAKLIEADLARADLNNADLREAKLTQANLRGASLIQADLRGAFLGGAFLDEARLRGADLSGASLDGTDLHRANLTDARLAGANLIGTDLIGTDLSGADLSEADLSRASLIQTKFKNAKLHNCRVYGLSVWDVDLEGAEQSNLIITPGDQPTITVDNLKVAQFVYMLANNPEVREVIDTITSKAVLILGRFTPECKKTLDAIHVALRQKGYVPILFDFDKPASIGFMETVSILANMARFVVADLTDEKVVLAELYQMVKEHPSKPVQPILLKGKPLNVLNYDFRLYHSYLPLYRYEAEGELLETLTDKVITPAERRIKRQRGRRPAS